MLWYISKWFFSLSPAGNEGIFLQYSLWGPSIDTGVLTHKDVPLNDWVPLKILPLRLVYMELPATHQFRFSFPYPPPPIYFHRYCCSYKLLCSLLAAGLSKFGGNGLPCGLASLIFQFVQFLLIKMEWWLPSFLHADLDTESSTSCFEMCYNDFSLYSWHLEGVKWVMKCFCSQPFYLSLLLWVREFCFGPLSHATYLKKSVPHTLV